MLHHLLATACLDVIDSESHASFPLAIAVDRAVNVTGTCQDTYTGTPYRLCHPDGSWSATQFPCRPIVCAAFSTVEGIFGETPAGIEAIGTCPESYHGSPTAACSDDGEWSSVSSPCEQTFCAARQNDSFAAWPETKVGSTAAGECLPGYATLSGDVPHRQCAEGERADVGEWAAPTEACIPGASPAQRDRAAGAGSGS